MTLSRVFAPEVFPAPARYLRAYDGAYALVPSPLGEEGPLPMAYDSADGASFAPAVYDLSTLDPGPTPTLGRISDRENVTATGDGRILYGYGQLVLEGRVGPHISLRPTAYTNPDPARFRRASLTTTADGRWWAGGHLLADSAKGMIFASDDGGATWTLFAEKLPGSVGVLLPTPRGLYALAFQSALAVTAEGVTALAKYRDEVWNLFAPLLRRTPPATLRGALDPA